MQTAVLHSNFIIITFLYLEIVGDPDGHEEICLELSPLLGIRDAAGALSAQLTLQVRHTALKDGPKTVISICQIQNVGIITLSGFWILVLKNSFKRMDHRAKKICRDKQGECIFPLSRRVHCNFARDGNRLKGGGRAPQPAPTRADFSVMVGCSAEIGNGYSVCTLRVGQQPTVRTL